MFYTVFSAILTILHTLLYFTTRVNIFPELFVFPWLVSKGMIPYADFFDHHGFLLYYVLALLSLNKSLIHITFFYHFIQLASLCLVLLILKKIASKLWFVLCGLLFVLLNYYFSDNNFWYENVFVFVSLFMFFISFHMPAFKGKIIIMSFLLFLCTLIKPTFGLLLVPYYLYYQDIKLCLFFSCMWLITLGVYAVNHALPMLIDSLFVFNSLAFEYIKKNNTFGIERTIFIFITGTTVLSLFLYFFSKRQKTILLLFIPITALSIFQGYSKTNILPFIPFFVFLIAYVGRGCTRKIKQYYLLIILLLCLLSWRKAGQQYRRSRLAVPYIENSVTTQCVEEVKKKKLALHNSVYFNSPEYYYLLDQKPNSYYLFYVDFITKNRADFEKRIVNDLENTKTVYVFLLNKEAPIENRGDFSKYLSSHYVKIAKGKCFLYYKRK